jgi:hypothetical protein
MAGSVNPVDMSHTFIDHEYVEQIREYASLLGVGLGQLKSYVRSVGYTHDEPFKRKCTLLLDRLAQRINEASQELGALRYPHIVPESWWLQRLLFDFENICGYLHLAVDQRLEGHLCEQSNFGSLIKNPLATNKVYIAIDNLMTYFIKAFLPSEIAEEMTVVVAFGPESGYNIFLVPIYLPLFAVVHVPRIDLCRCRYWTSLGHEAAHLYYDYAEMPRPVSKKLEEMISEVKKIGNHIWGVGSLETAQRQVEEIICDFAALSLCGLPDLLTFVTSCYDSSVDATGFKSHPPFCTRVDYMLRYIKDLGESDSLNAILRKFEKSWCIQKRRSLPRNSRDYIQEYDSCIKNHYKEIVDISRRLIAIPKSGIFGIEKWEKAISAYEEYKGGKPLIDLSLDEVEVFNLVWMKRFDVCKKLNGCSDFSRRFVSWHQTEGKIFNDLVDFLIQRQ